METVDLSTLRAIAETAEKLQRIFRETPEIAECLKLAGAHAADGGIVVQMRSDDRLVSVGEAARTLGVGKSEIYRYTREGILAAYYTPGSSRQKFWMSHLRALATRSEA